MVLAAAGLEQYIALDRPDIAYSVKTALQQMSKTHEVDEASNHQSCSISEEQSKVGLEVPVSTAAEEH